MTESPLLNLHKRLPYFRPYVSQPMKQFALLLLISAFQTVDSLICNRETEHQCICGIGPRPPNSPIDCEDFVQV